jgi:hypothetical protein
VLHEAVNGKISKRAKFVNRPAAYQAGFPPLLSY